MSEPTPPVEQLRKELLAVVYRYSQESEVTVEQTAEAFSLALESLGFAVWPKLEPKNFQTGAAELAMPTQGNRQPEKANSAPSSFANNMAEPENLLACPFCGREAITMLNKKEQRWMACCNHGYCGAVLYGYKTEKGAREAWNRRARAPERGDIAKQEAVETAFVILHEKWLTAGHRSDMNEAMDALSLALGRPALCKHPHGFPSEDHADNIIHSARMRIPGA